MPLYPEISLTPSQAELVQNPALYRLYTGGFYCGKTYMLGLNSVCDATHSSTARVGLYTKDHFLIKDVAMRSVFFWLAEFGYVGKANMEDKIIYTSSSGIGDFMFKSMEDPGALVGYSHYTAHIDELDTLAMDKAEWVWRQVLARNRQVPDNIPDEFKAWSDRNERLEVRNRATVYTTPEGYKFCYKRWEADKEPHERTNPDYQIIYGKTRENPAATEAYIKSLLEAYPEHLIMAYLEGHFVNMDMGSVYYAYDKTKHDSRETIQPGETLYIGMDFNKYNMAATIFVRRGEVFHAVYELVKKRDTPDMIKIIQEKWQNYGHQIIIYPDATAPSGNAADAATESCISQLRAAGFKIRARSKNPKVEDRVNAVNNAFEKMLVRVNRVMCPTVSDSLAQQPYDKNGKPNKKFKGDHSNDATGYPIAYEMSISRIITPVDYDYVHKRY